MRLLRFLTSLVGLGVLYSAKIAVADAQEPPRPWCTITFPTYQYGGRTLHNCNICVDTDGCVTLNCSEGLLFLGCPRY